MPYHNKNKILVCSGLCWRQNVLCKIRSMESNWVAILTFQHKRNQRTTVSFRLEEWKCNQSNLGHITMISEIIQDNSWDFCLKAIEIQHTDKDQCICQHGEDMQLSVGKQEFWFRNFILKFLLDTQEQMMIGQLNKIK